MPFLLLVLPLLIALSLLPAWMDAGRSLSARRAGRRGSGPVPSMPSHSGAYAPVHPAAAPSEAEQDRVEALALFSLAWAGGSRRP